MWEKIKQKKTVLLIIPSCTSLVLSPQLYSQKSQQRQSFLDIRRSHHHQARRLFRIFQEKEQDKQDQDLIQDHRPDTKTNTNTNTNNMASYPSSVTDHASVQQSTSSSSPSFVEPQPQPQQPSSLSLLPTTQNNILPVATLPTTTTATMISSLATNVQAVGAMWMISSAFFTTYSTTKFLKYNNNKSTTTTKKRRSFLPPPPPAPPAAVLSKSSSSSTTTTKNIMYRRLPHLSLSRSTLLTLYRFSGSLLIGIIIGTTGDLRMSSIVQRIQQTYQLCPSFVWPALFLFIANYANSISLDKMGISLTYVTKCAIPLFTVFLTAILDGISALPSLKVLLTLVPIAGGIATASWNHPHFELAGMVAALTSCLSQAALNVSSKKTMAKLGVSGPVAQRCMVAVGLLIAIMYSSLQLMTALSSKTTNDSNSIDISQQQQELTQVHPPVWLTLAAVLAYHIEYMLSFIFVTLVAPVTYSACDAVRRLSIIVTGHYMFGGPPFTVLNKLGIACALLGALGYSLLNH